MISESIDFILSHFDHQLNLFPRKMMTYQRLYQFTVLSKEEIVEYCKHANYIDCRIGGYPEYTKYKGIIRQPPDLVFLDLDLNSFNNDISKTNKVLKRIKNKIEKLRGSYTILWTGNGYHVYIPLDSIVLDIEEIFTKDRFPILFKSTFGKYYNYSVSEVFLKFTKEFFSNGKADPLHHPKYGNSLIRIPDTYNSKCLKRGLTREESRVKIIQKWDGKRLSIQLLLKDFRRWIVQEELLEHKRQNDKPISNVKSFEKSKKKNNCYEWIEMLLHIPIRDYRKHTTNLILSPYLINVKKVTYAESYHILINWLSECNTLRRLDFSPNYLIKSSLNTAISKRIPPMKLDTLKNRNTELYDEINSQN